MKNSYEFLRKKSHLQSFGFAARTFRPLPQTLKCTFSVHIVDSPAGMFKNHGCISCSPCGSPGRMAPKWGKHGIESQQACCFLAVWSWMVTAPLFAFISIFKARGSVHGQCRDGCEGSVKCYP